MNIHSVKEVLHEGTTNAVVTPNKCIKAQEELNGNNCEKAELDRPKDRYQFVYFLFIINGIGTLMPWNCFITASDYFDKKLSTIHPDGTIEPSEYKEYFLSNLSVTAQVPNVLFSLLNIFIHLGGENFTFRIMGAIMIEVIVIVLSLVLAILDTQHWISLFFWITMSLVVIINVANAIYQNSLYGLASKFPHGYTNAIIFGSNISGFLISMINILALIFSPDWKVAAYVYFGSAFGVITICAISYPVLLFNNFFRHFVVTKKDDKIELERSIEGDLVKAEAQAKPPGPIEKLKVLKYCWKQCLNVFLVFFVTLSVYPVIQAKIEPMDDKFFGTIESTEKYFTPVCCFLVFNTCAMLGNILPKLCQKPGPDRLWIPIVARFLFIPFFLFCNFYPKARVYEVYIQSDYIYLLGGVIFGLSSGYLSSLCMIYAPLSTHPNDAGTAGMMAAACLVLGIVCGVNFSRTLVWIIK